MRKLILIVSFLFLQNYCIKAQQYIPLPLDSTTWGVGLGVFNGVSVPCSGVYTLETSIDTLIQGVEYVKIKARGNICSTFHEGWICPAGYPE